MNIGVLGVGVSGITLDAAERLPARDIILDTTALASSLSLDQIHQLSQMHNLVVDYGNDTSYAPMSVDGSGSAVNGLTNVLDGNARDVREDFGGSSAMELDDTNLNELFYFSELGPLVSASTGVEEYTGPPQLPTSTSALLSPPPLQSSQTITPAYLDTSHSVLGGISSSRDHLLELQYLPESMSLTKPFGSLSDLQALSASTLDYPSAHNAPGTTIDMDISWLHQGDNIVLGSNEYDSRDNQRHPSTISNPLREMYEPANGNGYAPTSFEMSRDQDHQGTTAGGHHHGVNGTISSVPSYLPSSIELSVPSLLSPMVLHYDNQGGIMTNASAETGNMTGDSESFLFVLSRLGHADSVVSSSSGLRKQGESVVDVEAGIEPTSVLRRTGFAGSTVSSANGRIGQGSKRGQIQSAPAQYTSIPIPLPIPTRSKPTLLKGWQGDKESNPVSSFGESHQETTIQTQVLAGKSESKKRKRLVQPQSEDDESKEKSASLRREMLGLRAISKDNNMFSAPGDEMSEERGRKRRRVGLLSIANLASNKGKAKEIRADWDGSDEESESDSDSDIYCPSRSSSPAFDNYGSSSGSAQTVATVTTSMSSTYGEDDDEGQKQRKRNKGKAKGSAALALAKITMMSGKPAVSPWGTYVPFPVNQNEGQDILLEDDAEIRAGRRRRNGHIPLPIPIPHLIKKSRGRKVPYVAKEVASQNDNNSSSSSKRIREGEQWKRMFICEVPGCGKCFVRGEHLKRHVRSIHTHDKRTFCLHFLATFVLNSEKAHPCPYEGCDKSFSRRDNLGQHVRIHLPNNS